MRLLIAEPEVYLGGEREWMNLAQLAKMCGEQPEAVWSKHCFIFVDIGGIKDKIIIAGPRIPITTVKSDEIFYLDVKGNVLDLEGQKTGLCVNGLEGKDIGSWDELFVPKEWADEVNLTREKDFTWEELHPKN